jgi:hypothetical protein
MSIGSGWSLSSIVFLKNPALRQKRTFFLQQLFGEKVGPIAPGIICKLTLDLPAITSADELAQTLCDVYYVADPTVVSSGPGKWEITGSYAALHKQATGLKEEGLGQHGTGISNALVREFFHHRDGTNVPHVLLKPSPKLGKRALTNRAEMLTRDFGFLSPVGVDDDSLSVTLPQFQSLRSAWQSKAKISEGGRLVAGIIDEGRAKPPAFGTLKQASERDRGGDDFAAMVLDALAEDFSKDPATAAGRPKPTVATPTNGDGGSTTGKTWTTEGNLIRPAFGTKR